jgi:O-antigen/teichoic acid export membrane protein
VTTDIHRETGGNSKARRRGVASNSTSQLLSFFFRAVSGIGVLVLLAHSGGPRSVGIVQFALTLTGLLPFFYGIPTLLAREVARRPEDGRRWVEVGTLIALLFGAGFTCLLPLGAVLLHASGETTLSIGIAALGMAFDGLARVQFAAFWAWERMDLETLVTGGQEALYLAGTAAVLAWAGGGPVTVLLVFTVSRGVGACWGWLLAGRRLGGLPWPRAPRGTLGPTLRQCNPFAASDTLSLTYARFDAVLLGFLRGPVPVGLYQAVTNLVLYFNVIARSVNRSLFPRMGRAWPDKPKQFARLRDMSLRLIALLAVPVTVGSLLLAPRTIDFFYGPKFAPALLTYQLLILVIPIRMAGNTISLSLAATDRQKARTVAVAGAAVLNIGLNLYFIPRWSYLGAAMTTVICETGVLTAYALILRRGTGPSELFRSHAWPLLASLPMAAVILLTRHQAWLISAVAGGLAYVAAIAVVSVLRASGRDRRRPVRALAAILEPGR